MNIFEREREKEGKHCKTWKTSSPSVHSKEHLKLARISWSGESWKKRKRNDLILRNLRNSDHEKEI